MPEQVGGTFLDDAGPVGVLLDDLLDDGDRIAPT